MDNVINLALIICYLVATIIGRDNRQLGLAGLIALVASCITSSWLTSSYDSIVAAYGFDGYVYRWDSAMATISLLWFISIQKTNNLSILIPCATIFFIDAVLVVTNGLDTSGYNNLIVGLTVACHLTYCFGCTNGGDTNNIGDNSRRKSYKKASGGSH